MLINYNDPRFKKALLAGQANPLANQYGLASQLSANFAAQQGQLLTTLAGLQQQKDFSMDRLNMANRRFNLQKKLFNRAYDDESRNMELSGLIGIGTGLYSAIEGQRRKRLTEQMNAENRAFIQEQREWIKEQRRKMNNG